MIEERFNKKYGSYTITAKTENTYDFVFHNFVAINISLDEVIYLERLFDEIVRCLDE